ncbi:MAG TPA: hypothetical protein VE056_00630 [Pyrinomonadaceae bacterium]|nr:hypothetical protein [Pyrinomonadaceae bacterium]
MKNMNRYALGLAFGLGLVLSSFAFAQTITQADQKKTTESCCAMACCSRVSASMKDAKEHSSKQESCCSGDSCNMQLKDGCEEPRGRSRLLLRWRFVRHEDEKQHEEPRG